MSNKKFGSKHIRGGKLFDQFNKSTFLVFNKIANQSDCLNWIIVGVAEYLPFVFIACLLYLWLYKNNNYRENSLLAGYAAVIGVGVNLLITLFIFHPRPYMENIGVTIINHAPETSFPSDHTTFMLSIAFTLLFLINTRIIGLILMMMGVVGGLSRVAAGIHYPLDILGSMVVSIGVGLLVALLKEKINTLNRYIESAYSKILNKKA